MSYNVCAVCFQSHCQIETVNKIYMSKIKWIFQLFHIHFQNNNTDWVVGAGKWEEKSI